MILFFYLLKVVLCSTVLMGYYYLALRNKAFHQWNRFYLLATVVLSLLIPCFSFTITHTPEEVGNPVIQVLQVVTVSEPEEVPVVEAAAPFWKVYGALLGYGAVSVVLLAGLLVSLYRIYQLVKRHQVQEHDRWRLVLTTAKGTPFSFFNYLFWNPAIDMSEAAGQQIFRHELAHIEEKHSLDKLFLQLVLVGCWINPVFWLIRAELCMVHEFMADRKAVADGDASALAAMILQAAYPQHYTQLTNAFFHQSIKRRLHMLTKIQNPKRNYISRILFLPVMAVLTLAFTVRTELTGSAEDAKTAKPLTEATVPEIQVDSNINSAVPDTGIVQNQSKQAVPEVRYTGKKKIKVIVDAGHGGDDKGAGIDDVLEKDIALAIAKEIRSSNTNANIEIILTREDDNRVMLRDRVAITAQHQADLFVSVHVAAAPPKKDGTAETNHPKRGFEVYIPRDTVSYFEQSKLLGSAMLQQLNTISIIPALMELKSYQMGIWVLNHNTCPAVIVECGYVTNEKDRKFLVQKDNQQQVARKLLAGIESYLQAVEQKSKPVKSNLISKNITVDTQAPVVVKPGAAFTPAQLQAIPFVKLLQPDTDYAMGSSYFSIKKPDGGNAVELVLSNSQSPYVKQLIEEANSGDLIAIHSRTALTDDNKVVKLPNLVYFVQ